MVTFPADKRHRPLTSTELYCLVTEAQGVNNLPRLLRSLDPGENRTHDLMIASPALYC